MSVKAETPAISDGALLETLWEDEPRYAEVGPQIAASQVGSILVEAVQANDYSGTVALAFAADTGFPEAVSVMEAASSSDYDETRRYVPYAIDAWFGENPHLKPASWDTLQRLGGLLGKYMNDPERPKDRPREETIRLLSMFIQIK